MAGTDKAADPGFVRRSLNLMFFAIPFCSSVASAQQPSFSLNDTSVHVGASRSLPGLTYRTVRFPEMGVLPIDSLSEAMVKSIARFLKANPTISMEVGCYCDERASIDMSFLVTEQRCDLVEDLLTKLGIDEKRVVAKGYGRSEPIVDQEYIRWLHDLEAKEAAHRLNNRIVLVILNK